MADETIATTYGEARERFLAAARARGARLATTVHPSERGPEGEELAIDLAELGPADAAQSLLIVSGTHGVEGFAGSALQSLWLERSDFELPELRVVLLHGLNPFGFAWQRRTNEDNVDLNRNFIDWSAPPPHNADYDEIAALLVPDGWDDAARDASTASLFEYAATRTEEATQQTITGGQYRHVAGVFYGGTEPVWSHRWVDEHLPALFADTTSLGIIDLHTGLGPWGVGELIMHAARGTEPYRRAERWWGDVRSMRDGESVSADLSGDWLSVLDDLLPSTEITAAALEFGTVDTLTVLQALRGEAWMHNRGERVSDRADAVRQGVRAAFADDGPEWLAVLDERFSAVADAAMEHLGSAPSR